MTLWAGSHPIDTEKISAAYREKGLRVASGELLVTSFSGSRQQDDLAVPPNCNGLGRIRHFRRHTSAGWPANPLPIDPAARALDLAVTDEICAQVFQNAICNWRCWYCFVDFELLSANLKRAQWVSCDQLLDLYLAEQNRPPIIDLSGGEPNLTPEWVPWMMEALRGRALDQSVYLWSDDNLSTDYLWRHLTEEQLGMMSSYRNYGRVCCFKGFSPESFEFNTRADSSAFDLQFDLIRQVVRLGLDTYGYVTLTAPKRSGIREAIKRFVDALQAVSEMLPLRVVPLEIQMFSPVRDRKVPLADKALKNQHVAIDAWNNEMEKRFSSELRSASIVDIPLVAP